MFCIGTMKLNTQNYYLKSTYSDKFRKRKNAADNTVMLQGKSEDGIRLNKSTINKPAQAISFGGFFDSAFKVVEFVNENEAAYNSIYSLFVAGLLKPCAVMKMPGSEEKDKQMIATKNFLQAFIGSFLSLTIGGGVVKKVMDNIDNNKSLVVWDIKTNKLEVLPETSKEALKLAEGIIKKSKNSFVNKIKTGFSDAKQAKGLSKIKTFFNVLNKGVKYEPNIDEILEKAKEITKNVQEVHLPIFNKNPEFVRELKENALYTAKIGKKELTGKTEIYQAYKDFWKNSTGGMTAVAKAMIASALLPPVLNLIFGKRNKKMEEEKRSKQASVLSNSKQFMEEKANFKPFNKIQNNNNNNINFKGAGFDRAISKIVTSSTVGLEKLSLTGVGAFFAKLLSFAAKPSARMADLESFIITGYWDINTYKSKKIAQEQKLGFMLHTTAVTVISSTCAFILDALLDPLIKKRKEKYADKIKQIAQKVEDLYPQLTRKNSALFEKVSSTEAMNNVQIAQYTITKEINKILNDKGFAKALKDNKEETVKNIVEKLNAIDVIKNNNPVDKNLVERAIENLSVAKQLQDGIADVINKDFTTRWGSLFNAKGITKELSNMFLENTQTLKENPEIINNALDSLTKNYQKKMAKFKSLTIFTLVVRFIVPVAMVPFSGKLKNKFVEITSKRHKNKQDNKLKA